MQPLATWLVARPINSIMALAIALLLPPLKVIGGTIVVLLLLHKGLRTTVVAAVVAAAVVTAAVMISGDPPRQWWWVVVSVWLPAGLLAAVLQSTRSLTLTLQISVLVALVAVAGMHVVIPDMTSFWKTELEQMLEFMSQVNWAEYAEAVRSEPAAFANLMVLASVFSNWMVLTICLLIGYFASRQIRLMPSGSEEAGAQVPAPARFGEFQSLDFGKVLAIGLAVLSVLAVVFDAAVLTNLALMLFIAFWLQGLAVMHYLYSHGVFSSFMLIATYVMLVLLYFLVIPVMAVIGYSDAWFKYRRSVKTEN